jgi:hypothetical protein
MLRALAAYDCALNPSLRPQGPTRALWSCLADVSSCSQVEACVFGTPAICKLDASEGTFTACNAALGTTVVECGPGVKPPVAIEPCLLEGRRCSTVDETSSVCAGKQGVACSGAARCDGTYAVECKVTTDVGMDCASVGSGRCVGDDAGVACAPIDDARPCVGSSKIRCDDGGVARRCVAGREMAIDCARIGQPCADSASDAIDPMSACTNLDPTTRCIGQDECRGDVLSSCEQGKKFEVSCSSVGLGECVKPPAGRSPFATCTRR